MVCPGGRKGKDSFSEQQVLHLATVSKSLSVSVKLSLDRSQGPLDIDRIALGQGGLSADTMWEQREAEVRALHPRLIRLFVQETSTCCLPLAVTISIHSTSPWTSSCAQA